jgi:LDH2 family malate/lactate/ureidoglycolate dehydrogenase
MSETVLFAPELESFSVRLLDAAGIPAEKAGLMACALVDANLRGVDSHGVQLLPHYVEQVRAGDVDPRADGRIVAESDACLLYDGANGIGHAIAGVCCGHAVRLGSRFGIGMVVAREANHFGAAAFWARRISSAGQIGIAMCDASPQVPPWQGKDRKVGTNPLCVSVPHSQGRGWLLDMATTTVALGKIESVMQKGGTTLPQGWALDSEGRPTTELASALAGGMLMPLGGYKGSGLALMVELLSGVLGGGAMGSDLRGIRSHGRACRINQTFLAIDVNRFLPLEAFYARMDWLTGDVKSSQPAAGYDEVLVAGDPEWRTQDQRSRCGIPIPEGTWQTLVRTAERLGVALPDARQSN